MERGELKACVELTPAITDLAKKYAGKVKVGQLNVDENPNISVYCKVTKIPKVLLFHGSEQPIAELEGVVSEAELEEMIGRVVSRQ